METCPKCGLALIKENTREGDCCVAGNYIANHKNTQPVIVSYLVRKFWPGTKINTVEQDRMSQAQKMREREMQTEAINQSYRTGFMIDMILRFFGG